MAEAWLSEDGFSCMDRVQGAPHGSAAAEVANDSWHVGPVSARVGTLNRRVELRRKIQGRGRPWIASDYASTISNSSGNARIAGRRPLAVEIFSKMLCC